MKEYFKNRRSVRKYRDQGVPRELIVNLLQLAAQAPNTGNMQLYSVIITEEPNNIKKLAECHFNQPASVNAKAIVTFCVDYNRFEKWCRINNAKPGFENFQSFIAGAIDATILCQQFNTLAELDGLGCCYLGTTTYNAREISEVLNLPSRVVPICSLSLGWPESDSASTERLDSESFIHLEKYDDYNEEDIEMLYAYKDDIEENKRFVAENNKETLAQVFTDIRYPEKNNILFSEKYINFLTENKFI